ncbi:hypothetical protein ACJMK2_018480 [Sinanodonta woodiana]|uniref:Uncharacterized protein n=1 Tax=Sinanodonta woodiana TaxID=1069815 RepID=A0ABD3UDM6_SINWO
MEETGGERERSHHYYYEDGTELYVPYWVESATSGSFDRRWEYNWNQIKTRWVPLVLTSSRYLTPEPAETVSGHVIIDSYGVYSERKCNDDAVCLSLDNEKLRRKRTLCTCFFIVVGLLFVAAFLIPVLYTILSPADADKTELLGQYSTEVTIINLQYIAEMGDTSSPIFRQVASALEGEIDYLYMHRSLNKSYYGCKVIGLRNGSVLAKYDLYFRKEEGTLPPHDAVKSTLYTAERDEENKTLGKLGEYRFIIDSANVQGVNIVFRKNVDAAKRSVWVDLTQRHAESTYIPTKSPTRAPETKGPFIQNSIQATHTKSSTTISTTKISANVSTLERHTVKSVTEVPISKDSTIVPTTNNPKETLIRKSSTLILSSKSTINDVTETKRTEVPQKDISYEADLVKSSESSVAQSQTEKPLTTSETKSFPKVSPTLQISSIPTSTSTTLRSTTQILIDIPKRDQSFDHAKKETLSSSTTTKKTTSGPNTTAPATLTLKTTTQDVSSIRPISKTIIELSNSSVSSRYTARSTSANTLTTISPANEPITQDVLLSENLVAPLGANNSTFVFETSFLRLERQKALQEIIASVGTSTISERLVEEPHSLKRSEILATAISSAAKVSLSVGYTNLYSTVLVNDTDKLFRQNDKYSSTQISEDHLKELFPKFTENIPLHAEQLYSSGSTATNFLHSSMLHTFSSIYKNMLQQDTFHPTSTLLPSLVLAVSERDYYSGSVLVNVEYSSITSAIPSDQQSSILTHFHVVESAFSFIREPTWKGMTRSTVTEALSPSRTNRLVSLRRTLISKGLLADNVHVASPEFSPTESLYLSNSSMTDKLRTSSTDTHNSVHYIFRSQNVSLKPASTINVVSYASRLTVNETLSSSLKNLFPAVYYTPPIQDSFLVTTTIFGPESTKVVIKHTSRTTGTEMTNLVRTNITTSVADSYLIKNMSAWETTPSVKDIVKSNLEYTVGNIFIKSSLMEDHFLSTPSMTIVSSLEETKLSSETYGSNMSMFSMSMGYSYPMESYYVVGNKLAGTEYLFTSTPLDSKIITSKDYPANFSPSAKRLISDSSDTGTDETVLHTDVFMASQDTSLQDSVSSYWEQRFQTVSPSFDGTERRDGGLDYATSVFMFPPAASLSTYNVSDLTLRGMPDKQTVTTVVDQGHAENSVLLNINEAMGLLKTRSNKAHEVLSKNSEMTIGLSSISIDYFYDTRSLQSSSHLVSLPVGLNQQLDTKYLQLYSSITQKKTGPTVIQTSTFHQNITTSSNIHKYPFNSSNSIRVDPDDLMQSLSPFPTIMETSFDPGSYWTSDGFQSSNNDFIYADPLSSYASRSPAVDNNSTQIRHLNLTVDIIPSRSDWKADEFSNGNNVQSSYINTNGSDIYYSSELNTLFVSLPSIYNDHKDNELSILGTSAPLKAHLYGQKQVWSEQTRPTTSQFFSSHMTTMKQWSSLNDLHSSSNVFVSESSHWFPDSIAIVSPQSAAPVSDINWAAVSIHTSMMMESVSHPYGTNTRVLKSSYTYDNERSGLMKYESNSPVFLMPWSSSRELYYSHLAETSIPSLSAIWINPVHSDVTDVLKEIDSSLANRFSIAANLSTTRAGYIPIIDSLETVISASPSKLDAPSIDSTYSWSSVGDRLISDSSSYKNVISPAASIQTGTPETKSIDSLSDVWFVSTSESSVTGPTLLSQTTSSSLHHNVSSSWGDTWEASPLDSSMKTLISKTSMHTPSATNASYSLISDLGPEIWSDSFFTSSSISLVSSDDVPYLTSLVLNTGTVVKMPESSHDSLTTHMFDSVSSEQSKPAIVHLTTSKTNVSVSPTSEQLVDIWSEYFYDSISINSTSTSGSYMTLNTSVSISTDTLEEDIWNGWTSNSLSINPSSEFDTIITSKTINTLVSLHGKPWANILNDWTFSSLSINPASAAVVSATPPLLNISNSLITNPLAKMWNNWTLPLRTLGTDIGTTGMTTGGSLNQDATNIGMGTIPSWIANILGEWAIETLLDEETSAISPSETARWERGSELSILPRDNLQVSLTTHSQITGTANSTPAIAFEEYNSSIIIGANARIACSAINVPGWSRVDVMRFTSYQHRKVELIGVMTSDGTLVPGVVKNVMLNRSILYTDNFTIVMDFNHVECADEGTYMVRVFRVDTVVLEDRTKVAVQGEPSAKLSLPAEVVSGRWLLGITCKADLGYPPGRVIFQMKRSGQKEFVEFVSEYEVRNTSETAGCLTRVTYEFDDNFQPNHEWNLTTFRCAVIDTPALPKGSNMAASNEEILQFLPSDICKLYPGLRYIPHPFDDCKRYISCPSLYILSCDRGKCFDKSSSSCIQATDKQQTTTTSLLTGITSNFIEPEKEGPPYVRFTRSTYSLYIGEPENISCTIENMRGWKTIRISRLSSLSEIKAVATVTWPEGTVVDGFFRHVSLSEHSMATESGAYLIVEFKNVQCSDPGTYTCTVEGHQGVMGSSNASVTVLGKPEAALFLPAEIVEGRWVLGVKCVANIGYPPGRVIWQKRGPNQKEFTTFLTKYRMYNTTTTEGCLTHITYTFDDNFSPNVEWDFTELRCAVTDTPAIQDQSGLVVSNTETLKFVPANVCDSTNTGLIPHPYSTCELYINCPRLYVLQCPAGKCFDTTSQTCVL